MKQWIAKKILEQEEVTTIFAIGEWGKSMALSSIQMLEKVDKKSTMIVDNPGSFANAIATLGGERGLVKGLLSSLGKDAVPDRLCLEVHEPGMLSEKLLPSVKQAILLITSLSDEDTRDHASVKSFITKRFPMITKHPDRVAVVYNADIPFIKDVLADTKVKRMVSYGIEQQDVDIRATNIEYLLADAQSIDTRLKGMQCKVQHFGSTVPLQVNGGVGTAHLLAKLAALAVAHAMNVSAVELLGFLRQEPILPGRMKLIPGIKKSLIVDDTYEMSFESTQMTLQDASTIAIDESQKRIAILGSMPHEGRYTDQHHCLLGQGMKAQGYDMVVAIGEKGYDILRCAEQAGLEPHQLHHFESKEEAGKFVQHELRMGDLIMVKGNREEGLETVVKELMAFPLQAKEDLL